MKKPPCAYSLKELCLEALVQPAADYLIHML